MQSTINAQAKMSFPLSIFYTLFGVYGLRFSPFCSHLLMPVWVCRVAQPVADEIKGEHGDDDKDPCQQ